MSYLGVNCKEERYSTGINIMKKRNILAARIIPTINQDYICLAGIEKIKKYRFVPLKIVDDYLYIVVESKTDKKLVNNYMKNILPYSIKYFEIPNSDFAQIIDFISTNADVFKTKTDALNIVCNVNGQENSNQISQILTFSCAIVAGFLVTCLLGYTIFPALIINPLVPSIVCSYTLYPLCRYKFNISKAFPQGWLDFFYRLVISYIFIGLPMTIIIKLGQYTNNLK